MAANTGVDDDERNGEAIGDKAQQTSRHTTPLRAPADQST